MQVLLINQESHERINRRVQEFRNGHFKLALEDGYREHTVSFNELEHGDLMVISKFDASWQPRMCTHYQQL